MAGRGGVGDKSNEAAEQIGLGEFGGMANFWKALVAAHIGHEGEARVEAEGGIRLARNSNQLGFAAMNLAVLGFLQLSLGQDGAALPHFRPLLDSVSERKGAIATHPVAAFAYPIDALIAAGKLDEAAFQIELFEKEARRLKSPSALARASRCRGLLALAKGDVDAALTALERAAKLQANGELPFERARTLLALGRVQRRLRAKAAAKRSLEAALTIFDELPAPLWAAQARDELSRIGLRRAAPDGLTEGERRVAELAASGLTNREVAARLFMSPKTVEANLARAYRKLGIRSRAELGARLAR